MAYVNANGLCSTILVVEARLVELVKVINASITELGYVRVEFDRAMKKDAALSAVSSYTISSLTSGGVTPQVNSVIVPNVTSPFYVDLITSEHTNGMLYEVTVNAGPVGLALGSAIDSERNTYNYTGLGVSPTISSVIAIGENRIDVVFNEIMKDNSHLRNPDNYSFDNGLNVLSVTEIDGNTVKLVTSSQTPDTVYNLTINDGDIQIIDINTSDDIHDAQVAVELECIGALASQAGGKLELWSSPNIEGVGVALAGTNPNGKVFRSIDYGLTWIEVEETTEPQLTIIRAFSNGVALAGSYDGGKIFRSIDFGLTWIEVEDTTQIWICSVATFPNGVALAGSHNGGKIYRSIDYGLTWIEIKNTTETRISFLYTFPNGIALAGTYPSGKIYRSTDFGLTWVEAEDTIENEVKVFSGFSNGIVMAGTSIGGKIYRSIDYGSTWAEVEDTTETHIHALATFPNGIALAGTNPNGKIFRSIDYGLTWAEVEETDEDYILSLGTFSDGVALAGTRSSGKIFRSTDYGLTWAEIEDTSETYIATIETFDVTIKQTIVSWSDNVVVFDVVPGNLI